MDPSAHVDDATVVFHAVARDPTITLARQIGVAFAEGYAAKAMMRDEVRALRDAMEIGSIAHVAVKISDLHFGRVTPHRKLIVEIGLILALAEPTRPTGLSGLGIHCGDEEA